MEAIITETIKSYNQYMQKMPAGSMIISNLLREDRVTEALENIRNFTEGVIWLIEVDNLVTQNGMSSELNIDKINEYLNEINDGLTIQDYSLVADLFEYEISPFFENVQQISVQKQS
ncbi:hypothetical protein [Lysinibacillus piscis]|uniref:Uncharacterized protein n=1 Tax=Lysinibacillus piscis TaxID=2518931 RepID=A0ABQ5NHJ0_9BACI|nr:hypothetical protein [Lysinibacillus sp. KH24]GLC87826.1 hypothetical protein LYSBPC_09530 [Lysinibacillus sp. KH24]